MAICLVLNAGQLVIDNQYNAESCPGYLLLDPHDYKTFVEAAEANSLISVFNDFSPETFGAGFGGVLLLFTTGLAAGFILNAIRKGKSR